MEGTDRNGKKFQTTDLSPYDKKYLNKKFGKLTAISPIIYSNIEIQSIKKDYNKHWVFKCECGNYVCRALPSVKYKGVKDCGCEKDAIIDQQYIGKKFSKLTILKRDYQYKFNNNLQNNKTYYLCQCDCGNLTIVARENLLAGETKSCGCYAKELFIKNCVGEREYEDLSSQKFYKLQPLYRNFEEEKLYSYPIIKWYCKCDCGNFITVSAEKLKTGHTTSCGCVRSSIGEEKIENILKENNISYIKDKIYFQDLILPSGNKGRYDFIILNDEKQPIRIIEFDGPQHSAPSTLFGEDNFIKLQESDKIKNLYAIQHNIPLIRIPYTERDKITLDLLMSNKYLVIE